MNENDLSTPERSECSESNCVSIPRQTSGQPAGGRWSLLEVALAVEIDLERGGGEVLRLRWSVTRRCQVNS